MALDTEVEFAGKHCMQHRGVYFEFLMTGGMAVQAFLLIVMIVFVHNLLLYRAHVLS